MSRAFLKYYLSSLTRKSTLKILVILFAINLATSFAIFIFSNSTAEFTILSNSYLILSSNSTFQLILSIMFVIKIFVTSKTNNADLNAYTVGVHKMMVISMKILSIVILVSLYAITQSISQGVVAISYGYPKDKTVIFILSNILLIFPVFVLLLFVIALTFILPMMASMIILSSLPILLLSMQLIPKILQVDSNTFNYDWERNNINYVNVSKFNGGEYSGDEFGVQINYTNDVNTILEDSQFNDASSLSMMNPFDALFSLSTPILNDSLEGVVNNETLYYHLNENNMFSTTYTKAVLNENYDVDWDEMIILPVGLDNPNNMSEGDFIDESINTLNDVFDKTNLTDVEIMSLQSKLEMNTLWDTTLSTHESDLIKMIMGIDDNNSILYWMSKYGYKLQAVKKNLEITIKDTFEEEKTNLINLLWNSQKAYKNIFILGNVVPSEKLLQMFPNTLIYNELKPANPADIEWWKNNFIHINVNESGNITDFQVLNENLVYESIVLDINTITGTMITSKQDWDDFIDKYSTINNLKDLWNKLDSSIAGNANQLDYKNNVLDTFSLNYELEYSQEGLNKSLGLQYGGLLLLAIISGIIIVVKVTKKDVI